MDLTNSEAGSSENGQNSDTETASGVNYLERRQDNVVPSQRETGITVVQAEDVKNDSLMNLWYVSTPFEVVCLVDADDDDEGAGADRPRPLIAVDFGHAVWIEFVDNEDDIFRPRAGDPDAKWLRFVTFPPYQENVGDGIPHEWSGGEVRTLDIPEELDLDNVETINIDQSQGAVILSVREGKIFILCYE